MYLLNELFGHLDRAECRILFEAATSIGSINPMRISFETALKALLHHVTNELVGCRLCLFSDA